MKYIIGNWKAYKTEEEVKLWLAGFIEKLNSDTHIQSILQEKVKVVVCPPYPFIPQVTAALSQFTNIFIGSQNISSFDEGSYTGEVNGKMLSQFVKFAIIGHSERRIVLHETEKAVENKFLMCKKYDIQPILCVRDEKDTIPSEAPFVAYEPTDAIGTGKFKSVDEILEVKKTLKLSEGSLFIYGGSVNAHNCKPYLESNEIDGLLPGGGSLDPLEFLQIISQVN